MRRRLQAILCGALLALIGAAPAPAAAPEPDFVATGAAAGGFEGPCGLTTDIAGNIYVSDYYDRAVNVFRSNGTSLTTTIAGVSPQNGPCGLAIDDSGRLYVNHFHQSVQRFTPAAFPLANNTRFAAGAVIDSATPTGVAVNPVTGGIFVNARDHIAVYDSAGAHSMDIGAGTLRDGYGLAYESGSLYVADHADNTVKVFSAIADTLLNTITGGSTPPRRFISLRDSAVAVDRVTGDIYVTDATGSPLSERPEATVYVFSSAGSYKGLLKYRISTASPPGLAVDNSAGVTQGRVYVTSGITEQAVLYAYPRGSATSTSQPTQFSLEVTRSGDGEGSVSSEWAGLECDSACEVGVRAGVEVTLTATPEEGSAFLGWSGAGCSETGECTVNMEEAEALNASFAATAGPPAPLAPAARPSTASTSAIAQRGNLRVNVTGKLAPKRLPRRGTAPIAVSVGGQISTTDGTLPPRLKTMRIELNRKGRLDNQGLPTCVYSKIQPGSSSRALSGCRSSLLGKGSFSANITLAGQEPYPTKGRLLLFNGKRGGKPVLYGHIYSSSPFATSFVIVFRVQRSRKGAYGTVLNAPLPKAMDAWGSLTGLEMTLQRRYTHKGRSHSYISAGCPAPRGFSGASFDLARTSFAFEGGTRLSSTLSSTCKARG